MRWTRREPLSECSNLDGVRDALTVCWIIEPTLPLVKVRLLR